MFDADAQDQLATDIYTWITAEIPDGPPPEPQGFERALRMWSGACACLALDGFALDPVHATALARCLYEVQAIQTAKVSPQNVELADGMYVDITQILVTLRALGVEPPANALRYMNAIDAVRCACVPHADVRTARDTYRAMLSALEEPRDSKVMAAQSILFTKLKGESRLMQSLNNDQPAAEGEST